MLVGFEHTHWQDRALKATVPPAKLCWCPISVACWGARATELLTFAFLQTSPIVERLDKAVAALARKRGVFTTAAMLALKEAHVMFSSVRLQDRAI